MPGTRLNDTERHLQGWWNSLINAQECSYLKKLLIDSSTPIRGISHCDLDIKYPVTIFCGKNGSGKSTLLQLATLAFHHDDKEKRKTFKDFFYKTKYDPANDGISLRWKYSNGKEVSVHKGSKKWMHYERRPLKEVWFISPRDILLTQGVAGKRGIDKVSDSDFLSLSPKYLEYLNEILEKEYSSAEEISDRDISKCSQGNTTYSCLNMGVGERSIIHILKIFQQAAHGSLIAIDEIEMGIHPFALAKLADKIQLITYEKKLQVFITSHSRSFIDGFPREARIFVDRNLSQISPIYSPSTVYAISRMSNKKNAELTVYCEDIVACAIIKRAAKDLKTRIQVVPAGSKKELPKVGRIHLLSANKSTPMIYWDGDVREEEMLEFMKEEPFPKPLSHAKFLSEQAPEKDILDILKNDKESQSKLSAYLEISDSEIAQTIQRCQSAPDHHHMLYIFKEQIGVERDDILNELVKILLEKKPDLATDIYQNLKSVLDGNGIYQTSSKNEYYSKSSK